MLDVHGLTRLGRLFRPIDTALLHIDVGDKILLLLGGEVCRVALFVASATVLTARMISHGEAALVSIFKSLGRLAVLSQRLLLRTVDRMAPRNIQVVLLDLLDLAFCSTVEIVAVVEELSLPVEPARAKDSLAEVAALRHESLCVLLWRHVLFFIEKLARLVLWLQLAVHGLIRDDGPCHSVEVVLRGIPCAA